MITIILVDDHAIVRTGYRRLLDAEPGMRVVGEASRADEANAVVARTEPDVALVDLSLKGSSGIEAIRGMLARKPTLNILVLSMHEDAGHITQALRSGARGYLTKHSEPGDVIEAIRQVATGKSVFSEEISRIMRAEGISAAKSTTPQSPVTVAPEPWNRTGSGSAAINSLTPREFDVFYMFIQGMTSTDIAGSMHLSPKTILNNLTAVRQKLGVDNDFKLLHLAVRHGLIATWQSSMAEV